MSVSLSSKAELLTVVRSLVEHRILDEEDSRDLLATISAAQCMAYSLTYGIQPASLELGNRDVVWTGDTTPPNSTRKALHLMHYNTVSNGGTECLPVKYLERFHAVQHALVEKVVEAYHAV